MKISVQITGTSVRQLQPHSKLEIYSYKASWYVPCYNSGNDLKAVSNDMEVSRL